MKPGHLPAVGVTIHSGLSGPCIVASFTDRYIVTVDARDTVIWIQKALVAFENGRWHALNAN